MDPGLEGGPRAGVDPGLGGGPRAGGVDPELGGPWAGGVDPGLAVWTLGWGVDPGGLASQPLPPTAFPQSCRI